ncbi:heat-inducible transcriptional repressor HrcA [Croceicoccus gelatinilyticus]|uniref:heat-inducible transcriptional repressor HrcA n=1 Tax=Croceicoccus gelatinilyticus TaxID=2835536 RepID=UPI001BCE0F13|nr:heat-inducible transcriptional repressor HrcA [Croceicoccus gelatinilyticus]MBS7668764.1 heat-inducible transcriptional repressor HrcA [Croceicoccus gelatinilyticus]
MPSLPLNEMNDRAREIFRLVVEGYLDSGQPVGSKALATAEGINLSPASIRSVLADLERLGLLAAPHTSAGRMPTESGLRLFVDGMMQVAEPSQAERIAIERELARPGPVEDALAKTSAMLSSLSACAGVVMVPAREPSLSQMSLVPLGNGRALAVLVGADGAIENRVLDLPPGTDSSALEQAGNYISAQMAGRTLAEAVAAVKRELADERASLDVAARDLVERGLAVWTEDAARRPVLIVRGQANLLDETAIEDLERVRSLIDDIERSEQVAALLASARDADSARIFIGSENKLFSLSGSSVIASPYRDREGRVIGVVGVIGPTRLNYARLVPMVDFTARSLGRSLGRFSGPG